MSVYFSSVYHNIRAAFILCDGLVELTCKVKAEVGGWSPAAINFVPLLQLAQVKLDPKNGGIGQRCRDSHLKRNKMHHVNAMATVTTQVCADAILDGVSCIEHCFPGARAAFAFKIGIALRVVRVFSSDGSGAHRSEFQRLMNAHSWRVRTQAPKKSEVVVAPGVRTHWGLVIFDAASDVEAILNEVGAP